MREPLKDRIAFWAEGALLLRRLVLRYEQTVTYKDGPTLHQYSNRINGHLVVEEDS